MRGSPENTNEGFSEDWGETDGGCWVFNPRRIRKPRTRKRQSMYYRTTRKGNCEYKKQKFNGDRTKIFSMRDLYL